MLHSSTALAVSPGPDTAPASVADQTQQPPHELTDAALAARYRLRAVREPSVLPRVLEMFTLRDVIPSALSCRDCPQVAGEMLIELVADALTAQQAETIAARMRNVVPVLTVQLELSGV
jgi:hypothetical protein